MHDNDDDDDDDDDDTGHMKVMFRTCQFSCVAICTENIDFLLLYDSKYLEKESRRFAHARV